MTFETIIQTARERGASDIHLEGGMPMALRIRGTLRTFGEPLAPAALTQMAKGIVGEGNWPDFLARCSWDLSRTVAGTRCRINVLRSARGVGFAIRLLTSFQATLQTLNLHPDLRRVVQPTNGLVIITGPTGSGKTSTQAALLQELNLSEPRHIITVEQPIEYALTPRQSFIRQREVGRDTPSFEQALIDALREDPDVLMVGEMREPHVMRLTLSAAETGHLVLATMHSSTAAEALQRIASSFPAEIQSAVCAQLADCLVAVIAQRLSYRPEKGIRVPECEVLMASHGARALIRAGQFFKLGSVIETGAADGSWSFARYGEWLARKSDWHVPTAPQLQDDDGASGFADVELGSMPPPPATPPATAAAPPKTQPFSPPRASAPSPTPARPAAPAASAASKKPTSRAAYTVNEEGVLELSEGEDDPEAILRELEKRKG